MADYGDVGDFSRYLKGAKSAERQHNKRIKADCGSFFGEKNSCTESYSNYVNDNADFTKSIITKSVTSRVGKNGKVIRVERGYDPTDIDLRGGNATSGIERLTKTIHKTEKTFHKIHEAKEKEKAKKQETQQKLNANAKPMTVQTGGNVHP